MAEFWMHLEDRDNRMSFVMHGMWDIRERVAFRWFQGFWPEKLEGCSCHQQGKEEGRAVFAEIKSESGTCQICDIY